MTGARAGAVLALSLTMTLCAGRGAAAEPLRLRGNVYAATGAQAPAGLITLDAASAIRPWLAAEAVVWVGAGAGVDNDTGAEGDAMIIAVHLRDPERRAEARLGRILVTAGAVRPVHLDGVHGRVRGRWDMSAEAFAGVPVVPRFAAAAYDWAAGGRVSRALGDSGAAGVAYLQRRSRGQLDDHELGGDAGVAVLPWLDLAGRLAYDLVYPGVSDAYLGLHLRRGGARLELFAAHRSAARLLPATSLFSVLGDAATGSAGARATWRAAPRLDITATAAARGHGLGLEHGAGALGAELRLRGLLRLDDRGAGSVVVEVRRDAAPESHWSGARAAARVPVGSGVHLAAELELAVPDDPRDRGAVWPWALAAVDWRLADGWRAAAAVEAGASPVYRYRVDGLLRLSRAWEVAP